MEPPRGIEPRTYALRASPVFDGGGWSVSSSAEVCRAVYVWATAGDGRTGAREGQA
jgi:hypothetical protein